MRDPTLVRPRNPTATPCLAESHDVHSPSPAHALTLCVYLPPSVLLLKAYPGCHRWNREAVAESSTPPSWRRRPCVPSQTRTARSWRLAPALPTTRSSAWLHRSPLLRLRGRKGFDTMKLENARTAVALACILYHLSAQLRASAFKGHAGRY